ncbi:tRNA (adenosine(37)-N6)-dimethylallyltransferase MiaA [Candidatus Parcubacteria bacterium]|nr:MAG: tRNA (adenosine(37)-N6)-dimethylallyltransferase MiaA [Candidatus Parcubacteria bacterium]
MSSIKPKLIVIVGPTASGKTALAIKIAKKFGGEIISADSRQIYRGMDIGTAKPTRKERGAVPHHLIDIRNPNRRYTVAEYKRDAIRAIREILRKGKLPILAGGTGLYTRAVVQNLDIPEVKPNQKLRAKLERELKRKGLLNLMQKLIALDPEAAYIVDPKNPRRVIRALEVTLATKKPFSAQRKQGEPLFDVVMIGLNPPRESLHKKIEKRGIEMIRQGLVSEVRRLIRKYGKTQPAFDAIGYREFIDYLRGKRTLKDATNLMNLNTWHYAKRQMTWFRKDKEIHWVENRKEATRLVQRFLKKSGRSTT